IRAIVDYDLLRSYHTGFVVVDWWKRLFYHRRSICIGEVGGHSFQGEEIGSKLIEICLKHVTVDVDCRIWYGLGLVIVDTVGGRVRKGLKVSKVSIVTFVRVLVVGHRRSVTAAAGTK